MICIPQQWRLSSCTIPTNGHPERSLAVSEANRQSQSKDPFSPGAAGAIAGISASQFDSLTSVETKRVISPAAKRRKKRRVSDECNPEEHDLNQRQTH
jgi:hypothetical protein